MPRVTPLQVNAGAGLTANDGGLRLDPRVEDSIDTLDTVITPLTDPIQGAIANLYVAMANGWVANAAASSVVSTLTGNAWLYNLGPSTTLRGDGATTVFWLPVVPYNPLAPGMQTIVRVNGTVYRGNDRTVSSPPAAASATTFRINQNQLIFAAAPPANSVIQVQYYPFFKYARRYLYGIFGAPGRDNPDYTKFVQVFSAVQGYKEQLNIFIDSSAEGATYLGPTFTDMDELTTGGWSSVTTDIQAFGRDLAATGGVIDFFRISRFGYPSTLVANIREAGDGYIGFEPQLKALGIDQKTLNSIGNAGFEPDLGEERLIFRAMQRVTGSQLAEILSVLDCETPNITSLDQCLDPRVLFPNSYQTLQAPTSTGLVPIFTSSIGPAAPVNDVLNQLGTDLQSVTSAELGAANTALRDSLLQITGINTKQVVAVADVISRLEVDPNLDLVANLTQPVPPAVLDTYANLAPGGTGPDNTYVLSDFIGSIAGLGNVANAANTLAQNYGTVASDSNWITIVDLSVNLNQVLSGAYGIPPLANVVVPYTTGSVNYGNAANAIATAVTAGNGVLSRLSNATTSLISAQSSAVANVQASFAELEGKIDSEIDLLSNAGISLGNIITGPKSSVLTWVQQLPQFALDVAPGGANSVLTVIANTSNFTGQCILGALAEGRNTARLSSEGRSRVTVSDPNSIDVSSSEFE